MARKRKPLGFQQAIEYILDLLCYSYYCKADNLVSDHTFDELEKLYSKMFQKQNAPCRGIERECLYSRGVQVVYDYLKEKENEKK